MNLLFLAASLMAVPAPASAQGQVQPYEEYLRTIAPGSEVYLADETLVNRAGDEGLPAGVVYATRRHLLNVPLPSGFENHIVVYSRDARSWEAVPIESILQPLDETPTRHFINGMLAKGDKAFCLQKLSADGQRLSSTWVGRIEAIYYNPKRMFFQLSVPVAGERRNLWFTSECWSAPAGQPEGRTAR